MTARIYIAAEENFRPGLEVLLFSLRKFNPNHPPVSVISSTIREFPGCEIVPVSPKDYAGCAPRGSRFEKAWYKLEAFRDYESDIVIVLDADLLCLGDVSGLWEPHEADIRTVGLKTGVSSGVMALGRGIRKPGVREELIRIGRAKESWDGGDQGAIDRLIKIRNYNWALLPPRFNVLKREYKRPARWARLKDDIGFLHMVGSRKPWQAGLAPTALEKNGGETGFEELENLWRQYHADCRAAKVCQHVADGVLG